MVSAEEINVVGTKNIYVSVDEDIDLVTKKLRKKFGKKLRKYIVQDIPNKLGYEKKLVDEITWIYDNFVTEDFAHHNYVEEVFKKCIYDENDCIKQHEYFYDFSGKLAEYYTIQDGYKIEYSYLLRAIIMCYYKCNTYCVRSKHLLTFNETAMQEILYSEYKKHPQNPQTLETAILCHRIGEGELDAEYKLRDEIVGLYIKNVKVKRHNVCEYANVLEYWSRIVLDYYWDEWGDASILRKCDDIIKICPQYYEGHFAKLNVFDSRICSEFECISEKVKDEYFSRFHDELLKLQPVMLNDFEKNYLKPQDLLRFYYVMIQLSGAPGISRGERSYYHEIYENLPDWLQAFKELPVTKRFITNDASYDKWIAALNKYYEYKD